MTKESLFVNGIPGNLKTDPELLRRLNEAKPGDAVPVPAGFAQAVQYAPGRKDDGGKSPWGLLMRGCALGLAGVVSVLKFGAQKYAADSWQRVDNARDRYKDALYRHLHSIETRGFLAVDPETGLLEWFHVACNALFLATFAAMSAKAEAEKETH